MVALSITPLAPPVEARIAHVAVPDIELTAAPIGAIPLAFLRNQLTFCSLICPFIVQGAVTIPIGFGAGAGHFPPNPVADRKFRGVTRRGSGRSDHAG
ncbi:hypothetical protein H7J51_06845 [Mycobacterium crocinum]|uniref:Uncharacterized protein n=1 Tax=Mycolicibacterium crocinum TaxID=388459 RepID=A0ABY3TP21_9MYCO|nr:hypothetical protein [Mycolicibacterium crocinum]MCV7214999.1 hypothetical protein [Mycolicibacterium crocinum]ULN42066.1 hypothetical protein MI149_02740 [Mycolicibacterium crocinum]